jgi:hypothetical protein
MMGDGLTLVTNATKHNTPMANVAHSICSSYRLLCRSHFARMRRLSGRLHFPDTSRRDDPFGAALAFSMRVLNAASGDSSALPLASCCRSDLP